MSNCCEEIKKEISELKTVIQRLESQLDSRYVRRTELNNAVNSLSSQFVTRSVFNSAISSLRSRLSALERCTGCGGASGSSGANGANGGGAGGLSPSQTRDITEKIFRDPRWVAATDCLKFIIKGSV